MYMRNSLFTNNSIQIKYLNYIIFTNLKININDLILLIYKC